MVIRSSPASSRVRLPAGAGPAAAAAAPGSRTRRRRPARAPQTPPPGAPPRLRRRRRPAATAIRAAPAHAQPTQVGPSPYASGQQQGYGYPPQGQYPTGGYPGGGYPTGPGVPGLRRRRGRRQVAAAHDGDRQRRGRGRAGRRRRHLVRHQGRRRRRAGQEGRRQADQPGRQRQHRGEQSSEAEGFKQVPAPGTVNARVLNKVAMPKVKEQATVQGMWVTGETFVKAGVKKVVGYTLDGGSQKWTVPLGGEICWASDHVTADKRTAVLYDAAGDDSSCSQVGVIDLAAGSWSGTRRRRTATSRSASTR
ncbi:hypothetical protein NKH77_32890 [Streptomyces sp. M19]